MNKIMIQKITQNNWNFWTVNLIMRAKNCYPVVRFSGTPYRLVPSQKSTAINRQELVAILGGRLIRGYMIWYDVNRRYGIWIEYLYRSVGHTIRSTIAENPMIHANHVALCFIESELWPIEVLHCRNRDLLSFLLLWPWRRPDVVLCDTHDTSILIVDTYATILVSPMSRYTAVYRSITKYRETAQVSRVSSIPYSSIT